MRAFDRWFVWLGGAMFVVSLVVCGAWYELGPGEPLRLLLHGESRQTAATAVAVTAMYRLVALVEDSVLVTIFALHHSVLAREGVKRRLPIPTHLARSVYVWTASVLLILVCLLWRPIGVELYHAAGARAVAHALLQLSGVALIAAAVRRIDPLDLAGIRASPPLEALQIAGPYRLVRHPLYLGWMIAVFGAGHMTGDRLAFAALTSIYLVVAVPWEERLLRKSFSASYEAYARRVRWRIIPFVY
jgi:protein-S-isoprenylcysteine O-methyltransferase Ste14